MAKTHLVLDGLQDPAHARELSARWLAAGFRNAVDPSGQHAWLERDEVEHDGDDGPEEDQVGRAAILGEDEVDEAAAVARAFGIEPRDRVGVKFVAANDRDALMERMRFEYKSRLATALVFGLPALVLHYFTPFLAGGGHEPARLLYPWLFELLLVGWLAIAAGWPILWQGAMAAIHLRATGDLLTSAIVVAVLAPAAVGVTQVLVGAEPWWWVDPQAGAAIALPPLHAATAAVMLACLQRWRAYRAIDGLAGRADLLIARFTTLLGGWLIFGLVGMLVWGWAAGLGLLLLLPPLASLGAVNARTPGVVSVLPVVAFAALLVMVMAMGGGVLEPVRIVEVGALFQLAVVLVYARGWGELQLREGTHAD